MHTSRGLAGGHAYMQGAEPKRKDSTHQSIVSSPESMVAAAHETIAPAEVIIRVGILLVDDHELLAHSVAVALNLDPEIDVVAIETDPNAGLVRVFLIAPDVVIVDQIALVPRLHEGCPEARVLALGAAVDQELVLACIRAGVDGCVGMRTSPDALGQVIKRIYAGEAVYETRVLVQLLHNPPPGAPSPPRRTANLAKRELEVLTATAMGLNTAEAAAYLGISINTLRTHLKNILAKLEARSKLEAVLIAIREGRIDLPEDPDRIADSPAF